MRPRHAKIDRLGERGFHRRIREQGERITGDGAVMMRASDRVFERAVLGHQADGMIEVGIGGLAAFQRAPPELALGVVAAAEGKHDRQRDLSFAEIIADVLSELRGLPGCQLARMSGSGATCFGLFSSATAARAAGKVLRDKYQHWWVKAGVLGRDRM